MTKKDTAIEVMTQASSDLSDIILKDIPLKAMWREVTKIETTVQDCLRQLSDGEVMSKNVREEFRLFSVTLREVMEELSEREHS